MPLLMVRRELIGFRRTLVGLKPHALQRAGIGIGGFRRTLVGLKLDVDAAGGGNLSRFRRTLVGLKLGGPVARDETHVVSDVPLWG